MGFFDKFFKKENKETLDQGMQKTKQGLFEKIARAVAGRSTATAELIGVEGRKLKFKVSASDEDGLIGEGEHLRFIVGREKFMNKVK